MLEVQKIAGGREARQPSPIGVLPASLDVSVTHTEGRAVVTLRGDLDLATHDKLHRTLDDLVGLNPAMVEVDLSQVGLFDCGAIGEFIRARSALRAAGSTLVLRAPSAAGLHMLEVVGLVDLIALSSSPRGESVPSPVGREPEAVVSQIAVLTDAWRTACETHPTMSWPIVFRDPALIVAGLLQALDVETQSIETSAVSHSLPDTLSQDAPVAQYAVQQLLELRRVMQAWIGWGLFAPARHRELQRRLTVALDASLVEVVSAALAELECAVLLDPLTGLMNRRALDRDLTQFLATARRHGRALTVVMLDVVGLKRTNDRFGHEAGDDLLQDLAAGLVGAIRVGDNVYRIGGDEFVLLLPDLRPEDVDAVMARTVISAGGSFTWGSAGVPTDTDSGVLSPASLLKLADQRMIDHRARRDPGAGVADSAHELKSGKLAGNSPRLVQQLEAAARSHSIIEQAKGIVAEYFQVDVEAAAQIMASFSSSRDSSVRRTAFALVDRAIGASELSGHAPLDVDVLADPDRI